MKIDRVIVASLVVTLIRSPHFNLCRGKNKRKLTTIETAMDIPMCHPRHESA